MADNLLTTSSINSLVNTFTSNEVSKKITPLNNQKVKYQKLSSTYSTLITKLGLLKSTISDLKLTGTSSLFNPKAASTSNSSFVTATASSSAAKSAYALRVNQLAKSDIALSLEQISSTANAITPGTHSFVIKTGDGSTGEYISNIDVTFTASETNQTIMEKIRDAINDDKAVVQSTAKTAANAYAGGASSFVINVNGTETTVNVNGGGTYNDLINELITNINSNVSGVTAEKVVDSPSSGDVKLKLTVNDSSKYVTITNSSGNDLVSELGIGVTNEKGASGIVNASMFSPSTGKSQFSLTSKESGLDYRITDMHDSSGTALDSLGLNLGTSRTEYDNSISDGDPVSAGYMYASTNADTNLLNAKVTFNGISVQRNSNTMSDLAAGVTFTLKSVMASSDSDVTVTVNNDVSAIESKIQTFITRFNDVYSFLKTNTAYSSGTRGVLISDGNASSLLSYFKSISYSKIAGLPEDALSTLQQIGISFDINNGLSISSSSTLGQKLSENVSQVEALFNSSNGIANSLYTKIDPFLGSTGYLTNTQSKFDSSISYLSNKISTTQKSIDKSADVLRNRYMDLQSQLATLINTQTYINSLFSSGSAI